MFLRTLGKLYWHCHPFLNALPFRQQIKIASIGRSYYMQQFIQHRPVTHFTLPSTAGVTMWGIDFRSPLANSAGMFKNGEGYDVVARLGAGAFLGGTSTANPRYGNRKDSINLPFISLPRSKIALNWLGLPNLGDALLANMEFAKHKVHGCPIGWSVMRSPDFNEVEGLQRLVASLWAYHNNAQVDFIEINESCPNIKTNSDSILPRLEYIAEHFLAKRQRHLPVIVKLSTDISVDGLKQVMKSLIYNGYDGVNLGNTSTFYQQTLPLVVPAEQKLFNFFMENFGGGLSGMPLKKRSLELCANAAELVEKLKPAHEFHIIRSGGIDCYADILASKQCGISFNQWYTGFFHNYQVFGDNVYKAFFETN